MTYHNTVYRLSCEPAVFGVCVTWEKWDAVHRTSGWPHKANLYSTIRSSKAWVALALQTWDHHHLCWLLRWRAVKPSWYPLPFSTHFLSLTVSFVTTELESRAFARTPTVRTYWHTNAQVQFQRERQHSPQHFPPQERKRERMGGSDCRKTYRS